MAIPSLIQAEGVEEAYTKIIITSSLSGKYVQTVSSSKFVRKDPSIVFSSIEKGRAVAPAHNTFSFSINACIWLRSRYTISSIYQSYLIGFSWKTNSVQPDSIIFMPFCVGKIAFLIIADVSISSVLHWWFIR